MRVKQKKNRIKRVSIEYFLYFCGLFNIKAENEYETNNEEVMPIDNVNVIMYFNICR